MPGPIFLVGFPRSGTTLFDQFLAGHPDLQTLEERPTLDAVVDVLCKDYGSLPGALKKLGPADISRLRNLYWETVDQHLKRRANSRLIDRMPLDLLHVPLVSLL